MSSRARITVHRREMTLGATRCARLRLRPRERGTKSLQLNRLVAVVRLGGGKGERLAAKGFR